MLVYVTGLHAVQFGNNWMKKIPRTAKIGRGRVPSPIWLSVEFFELNYFQIEQACRPFTYSWLVNTDFSACHRREILYTRARLFVYLKQ